MKSKVHLHDNIDGEDDYQPASISRVKSESDSMYSIDMDESGVEEHRASGRSRRRQAIAADDEEDEDEEDEVDDEDDEDAGPGKYRRKQTKRTQSRRKKAPAKAKRAPPRREQDDDGDSHMSFDGDEDGNEVEGENEDVTEPTATNTTATLIDPAIANPAVLTNGEHDPAHTEDPQIMAAAKALALLNGDRSDYPQSFLRGNN